MVKKKRAATSTADAAGLEDLEKQLQAILNRVRKDFVYKPDLLQYSKLEHWQDKESVETNLSGGKWLGDCDDFALTCRYLCRQEGLPSRLVYCLTESDEGHLVLEVKGWILDNRHRWVVPQKWLNYTWLSISGYEQGEPWRQIVG
jgi:predicted transglutaminase-like cysteine proteinase